jgi:nicotinate-nucleotide pyrophosphorylase (carboxylating)
MNKIIKMYYDKSRLLTTKNKVYAKTCIELFDFQLKNDLVENDITSKIIKDNYKNVKASIISKENGIISGIEEVIFLIKNKTDLKVIAKVHDGAKIKPKNILFEISGNPIEILKYERVILNILQRMSGIATFTNSLIVNNDLNTPIASTRKTLWGLLDKKAVFNGGGLTHRISLSDEILIKDNHIDLFAKKFGLSRLESIGAILAQTKVNFVKRPFEIEVENEKEAFFLNNYYIKINIVAPLIMMLDNFSPSDAIKTINTIRSQKKPKNVFFELSGGINYENIKDFDKVGANVISLGALTHSSKALDISLQLI